MTSSGSHIEQQEHLLPPSESKQKNNSTSKNVDGRWTGALALSVFAATFGGAFQFGFNIGAINSPKDLILAFYNESHNNIHPNAEPLTNEYLNGLLWSVSVSIFALGGMIGGLCTGYFADLLGRKGALLWNNILAVIAISLMSLSKLIGVYYLFPIGRLLIGINAGFNSGLVPMYLTEISPSNLRGSIGSTNQLLVTVAIVVSQLLALPFLFGTTTMWPFIFAFAMIPVIIMLVFLPMCPESPKYTLIVKGNRDQAESDLKKLRNQEDVSEELELIDEESVYANSQPKVGIISLFTTYLRWPIFIAVMMMLSQQLSGINAAMFYSTDIFKSAGLTKTGSIYATIFMGTINVIQTIISVWLVDHPRFGRRSLHITGLIGMLFTSIGISISLTGVKNNVSWASYPAVLCVYLFVISFATGPGSIPWFYVCEIFPSNARGSANSVAVLSNWSANFLVALLFPTAVDLLGQYAFLIFTGFVVFFLIFTIFFVPETKNKTVDEVHEEMKLNKQE